MVPIAPPPRRSVRALNAIAIALFVAGTVVLGFIPYALYATHGAAVRAQGTLGTLLPHLTPAPVTPTHAASNQPATLAWQPSIPLGTPLTRLSIPAAGVHSDVVVEGTDEPRLEEGPGHYVGTALPGEAGNIAIAGHRTTWLHPFYNLQAVQAGDRITLTVAQLSWTYVVTRVFVVAPTDVGVIAPLKGWWLTLTTCNPRYSAAQRLVVRAHLVSKVTAAPAAAPARVAGLQAPPVLLSRPPLIVLLAWFAAAAALLIGAALGLGRRHRLALLAIVPAAMCCFEGYGTLVHLLPTNL